ncbi:MAG: SGNH/GDSL hydrolase family protein [Bacteroidales bacterium]|nr:SGNH/GDSL hydrolase family protein [Bacteroidales bacterium]
MKIKISITVLCGLLFLGYTAQAQDWPNLGRYRAQNDSILALKNYPVEAVFMGNSITDFWIKYCPEFFSKNHYLDRGISGQTTPQILLRFRADVIDLHPKVVLILAGTNDIAGNTGPATPKMIEENLASMCDLATAHHIRVVLCSLLPALDYWWHHGVQPAPKIVALNKWIKNYAEEHHYVYLDYFSVLADKNDGFKKSFSDDGVHPNLAGYKVMMPMAQKAIAEALQQK